MIPEESGELVEEFIFFSDVHVKDYKDKTIDDNGFPRRLNEILNCVKQALDYAVDNNIRKVVIGGDINDTKNIVHISGFVALKQLLKSYDLNYYILHGNHDSARMDNYVSAIQLLEDENTTIILNSPYDDSEGITYIPYSKTMIQQIKDANPSPVLVAHLGLTDAELSSHMSIRTGISSNDLKKFGLVLLGHYHMPQKINNVYYAGSLIQLKKDEAGEEKRFLHVKKDLSVISIPTAGYRRYRKVILNKDKTKEEIANELTEAETFQNSGDFVEVYVEDKNIEIEDKWVDKLKVRENYEEEVQLRGLSIAMSDEELMNRYLEIENIPETDRNKYIEFAKSML